MNTNPDETKLALWLEDELQGADLAAFEVWLGDQADQTKYFSKRDEARAWRHRISSVLPASVQPPYPDFFNKRIEQAIRQSQPKITRIEKPWLSWKSLLLPVAACIGMVLTFMLGMQNRPAPLEVNVRGAPKAIPVEPILYTPETGVVADFFSSQGASATVIILSGVDAIPDETDFSETAFFKKLGDRDSTADIDAQTNEPLGR